MNTHSLRFRPLAAAILCSLIAPALFAQTATTTPVGFITVTIPAAADASTPADASLSIPLYNTAAYVSAVSTLDSANQFTMSGAAWTAGAFANAATPYLARIKVGTNAGRFFLISANTTNQLTVTLPVGVANINTLLSVNDTCEIVPANTLGSIFGTTTPILQPGATADVADNVYILNGGIWETYFHNGTSWRKSGGLGSKNNIVIYPDEGMFIVHLPTSAVTLTLMGTVPSTTEKTDLIGGASTFVANRFPVDIQLVNIGFQSLPNWLAGATADVADDVYAWNSATKQWDTYFYNGTNWRKSGGLGIKDTTVIPAGTAVVVSRSNASTATLTQTLPYVP